MSRASNSIDGVFALSQFCAAGAAAIRRRKRIAGGKTQSNAWASLRWPLAALEYKEALNTAKASAFSIVEH